MFLVQLNKLIVRTMSNSTVHMADLARDIKCWLGWSAIASFIHIRDTLKRQELKLPNNQYKRNCNNSYKQNILIVISLLGILGGLRGVIIPPNYFLYIYCLLVSFLVLPQNSNHRQQHTAEPRGNNTTWPL